MAKKFSAKPVLKTKLGTKPANKLGSRTMQNRVAANKADKSGLLQEADSKTRALRLGVLGSTGKMGRKLSSIVVDDVALRDHWSLVYQASGPQDPNFKMLAESEVDVVIDFSAPRASLQMAKLCAELKVPLLVCTTGFSLEETKTLERTLKKSVWAWAPNTSLGVFALKQVLKKALEILPKEYSFEIIEVHHAQKKDAPSGTAKLLLSEIEATEHPLAEVHSIRGGSEVGEHRVLVLGPQERLELTHQAQDRSLFAYGALRLAEKLATLKPKGQAYTVDELFV